MSVTKSLSSLSFNNEAGGAELGERIGDDVQEERHLNTLRLPLVSSHSPSIPPRKQEKDSDTAESWRTNAHATSYTLKNLVGKTAL